MSTILEKPVDFKLQDRKAPVNSPGAQKFRLMKKGGASNSGNILNDPKNQLLPAEGTGANFLLQ